MNDEYEPICRSTASRQHSMNYIACVQYPQCRVNARNCAHDDDDELTKFRALINKHVLRTHKVTGGYVVVVAPVEHAIYMSGTSIAWAHKHTRAPVRLFANRCVSRGVTSV